MSNCYPNRPNCKEVLELYHKMMKKIECLAKEQEELVDKNAVKGIVYAIKSLKKSFILLEEIERIEEKAEDMLEDSGCGNTCNGNTRKCNCFKEEAIEHFQREVEYLFRALQLLEQALCAIEESVENRRRGYAELEKYIKCIHEKKPSPPCGCRD